MREEARQLIEQGNASQASAVLTRCIQTDPKYAPCWSDLGLAQAALSDRESARRSWERAIALDPTLSPARYNLGQLAVQIGDLDRARDIFEELVRRAPQEARGWRALGEVSMDLGDVTRARQAYEQATRAEPTDADGWSGLASAQIAANAVNEARASAEQARKLAPRDSRAQLIWAVAVVEGTSAAAGELSEAERILQSLSANRAYAAYAASGLGTLRLKQGRTKEAAATLGIASRLRPQDFHIRYQWARALLAAGEEAKGRRELESYRRDFKRYMEAEAIRLRLKFRPGDADLRRRLRALEAASRGGGR